MNHLDDDSTHESYKAVEKRLRTAIDDLNDARIYYAEDPSDRNLHLLRKAKEKVAQADSEKAEFLESLDEASNEYPWE
ncbi:MAG: hypothetical protein KIS66_00445 [Fimbriimonadaceae bacterium]|nr:hypothetical protein [Fimbriimonadaceae bacterium]